MVGVMVSASDYEAMRAFYADRLVRTLEQVLPFPVINLSQSLPSIGRSRLLPATTNRMSS